MTPDADADAEAGRPALFETAEGPRVSIDGTAYDWFRGNGYLGLYAHPQLIQAAVDATLQWGLRLRPPRPVGSHPCVLDLERNAVELFESEAVALFGSGYAADAGLVAGLDDDFDVAFIDEHAHYSVVDAVKLSSKPVHRFAHLQADGLKQALDRGIRPRQRPLLLCEGILPTSGAIAPLPDYWQILHAYDGAILAVDEAHSLGVLGARGKGALEYFGLEGENRYSAATLSKALGSFGGLVPGSRELVDRIAAKSGNYRGSALPPPGIVAASARALALLSETPALRGQLASNVRLLRTRLSRIGLPVDAESPSPIICLDDRSGLDLAAVERSFFHDRQIGILHARHYPGGSREEALVFTVFANHTREQLDRLVTAFGEVL